MNRREIAEALAMLGEKRGIVTLLDMFRGSSEDDYDRHEAGNRLNALVGRSIYRGTFEPGSVAKGNFDEAARQFDAWWAKVKSSIHYDVDRRAWVTD